MAKFFDNLRASADQSSPGRSSISFLPYSADRTLVFQPANQDITKLVPTGSDFIRKFHATSSERKAVKDEVNKLIKEATPLRNAIRNVSGGKVLVDNSIYDKTELGRLYETVKAMQEQNDGALPPGYTVISNAKDLGGASGTADYRNIRQDSFGLKWQLPSDNYGTKNAPYRVNLDRANNTDFNDNLARNALENGWTIENFNDDDVEAATHTHELAHTAYYDALKKTQNPALTFSNAERKKREEFRNTHPSLQEIFDVAARNTGYDTVADAAASISGYAFEDAEIDQRRGGLNPSKNWTSSYQRLPELFAEAYSDVFYNKDYASDYSKEVIKLYKDYVKDYNKTFKDKIGLDTGLSTTKLGENKFAENWRKNNPFSK